METYVRLRPYEPRLGFQVLRLHWNGNLFVGGARPTWYRVDADVAAAAAEMRQDSGAPMFEVVDEVQKLAIDSKENALHMAALGIAAATVAAPKQTMPVDLTAVRRHGAVPPTSGNFQGTATPVHGLPRSAAIPPAPTPEPSPGFGEAPSGDLSTDDLK